MAQIPMTAPASPPQRAEAGRGPATQTGKKPHPQQQLLGYILVAPIALVMIVVIAYPLGNAVYTSLFNQKIIGSAADFVGFDTYRRVLTDGDFWSAMGRSGIWLIANLLVQTILAFAAALLLQRRTRWSRAARTWIVLPWAIPTVAVAVIWQWMLNTNYGVLHKLFGSIGIDLGSTFASPSAAFPTVILVNSWHWFPLAAVIIYGALATVPHEVLEAARVDGASSWQSFWQITLPLLQPILFALGLVGSLWSFNILDTIYLTTQGGPAGATTTIPVYIYDTAFNAFRSSQAAAASIVSVVILALAAYIFFRLARPKEA